MKNIILLFGGRSSEYEVSLSSATGAYNNIDKSKYTVHLVGIFLHKVRHPCIEFPQYWEQFVARSGPVHRMTLMCPGPPPTVTSTNPLTLTPKCHLTD